MNVPWESPDERHRRRLAMFCRWLADYLDHDDVTRKSIDSLALAVASGGLKGMGREAALDHVDELLELDRQTTEEQSCLN